MAGESKSNKQKPSPVVKPQSCSSHCTTWTYFKGARMLPLPPPNHHLMVKKHEMFHISSAKPKEPSLQNSFAPRSIGVIDYSCSPILLVFQRVGKYNTFIREGIGIWCSPAVYCWKFTLVLFNLSFAKPLGSTKNSFRGCERQWKISANLLLFRPNSWYYV